MSIEFDEVWRWAGWTTLNEDVNDGAVDVDGNVIVVGAQGYATEANAFDDTFVDEHSETAVKLDGASGAVLWSWTASSLGSEVDVLFAVATDSNNDVVMGGRTEGYWSSSSPDNVAHMAAVKLDGSTGNEIWRYQKHAPDSSTSWGLMNPRAGSVSGVAVDGDDNCLLVGQTYGNLVYRDGGQAADSDFFVIKLDGTDGSQIWTIHGGESTGFDAFRNVVVDSAGDLIAVGIGGDVHVINVVVVKLSGIDGSVLWEYLPVTSSTHDGPYTVDVDAQDDVYFCGVYDALNLQGSAAETPVVLKLDGATGDVVWTYEGVATSGAGFYDVAVDRTTGWVVGAGWTEGTWVVGAAQGGFDFAAVLLDGTTGDELARYQNGTTEDETLSFVGFDSAGGLFMGGVGIGELFVGGSGTDTSQDDFVAIKFAPFGDVVPTPAAFGPTAAPTVAQTPVSATSPTRAPTPVLTTAPTLAPAPVPTTAPTRVPTPVPTTAPSRAPTPMPPTAPMLAPTQVPTTAPTPVPTTAPTVTVSARMMTPSPVASSPGSGYLTSAPQGLRLRPLTTPSPVGRGGLPTPAPTTPVAAAEALSERGIGALAGAGGLLFLLLGLCLLCIRRTRPQSHKVAAKEVPSRPLPVADFGGRSVWGEILRPQPPVKASGMGEVAPLPPYAPENSLPPQAELAYGYHSPSSPPPKVAAAETEELPSAPPYEEVHHVEPTAPPAETPIRRLANRVVRVPSKNAFEQDNRGISVSRYAP